MHTLLLRPYRPLHLACLVPLRENPPIPELPIYVYAQRDHSTTENGRDGEHEYMKCAYVSR